MPIVIFPKHISVEEALIKLWEAAPASFMGRLHSHKTPTIERAKIFSPYYFLLLIINLSVLLFFLVLLPLVDTPQGVTGCRPPEVLPSPPP